MMQRKRFLVPPDPLDFMDIRIDYGGFVAWDNNDFLDNDILESPYLYGVPFFVLIICVMR